MRKKLPAAGRALLAQTPFAPVPPGFVGGDFKRRTADAAIRGALRDGRILYIVAERKIVCSPEVLAQLLAYREALLRRHRRLYPDGPDAAVLLAVIYSGRREWNVDFAAAAEQQALMLLEPKPLFGFLLLDLVREDIEALAADPDDPAAYAALKALAAGRGATADDIRRIFEGAEPHSDLEQQLFLALWDNGAVPDRLLNTCYTLRPHLRETAMTEREQRHQAIGRAEGKTEGKAEILLMLIRKRLGTVPEAIQARVAEVTPALLDSWADALLDARSIDADSIDAILKIRSAH